MARRKPKPEVELLPPGTTLLYLVIRQRPVPWTPARVLKRGVSYKEKGLALWQRTVAWEARLAIGPGVKPYAGPVEVHVVASISRHPLPDATNILKAVEDALQGVIYVNDRQVVRNSSERLMGDHDSIFIGVDAT